MVAYDYEQNVLGEHRAFGRLASTSGLAPDLDTRNGVAQ